MLRAIDTTAANSAGAGGQGGRTDPTGTIHMCGRLKNGQAGTADEGKVVFDQNRYFLGKIAHFVRGRRLNTGPFPATLHHSSVHRRD